MTIKKLSKEIARDIFKVGDELGLTVNRIQFMAYDGDEEEIGMGGFNEDALARCIESSLNNRLSKIITYRIDG